MNTHTYISNTSSTTKQKNTLSRPSPQPRDLPFLGQSAISQPLAPPKKALRGLLLIPTLALLPLISCAAPEAKDTTASTDNDSQEETIKNELAAKPIDTKPIKPIETALPSYRQEPYPPTTKFQFLRHIEKTNCLAVLVSSVAAITTRDCLCSDNNTCTDTITITVNNLPYKLKTLKDPSKNKNNLVLLKTTPNAKTKETPCWILPQYPNIADKASEGTNYSTLLLAGLPTSHCATKETIPKKLYFASQTTETAETTFQDIDSLSVKIAAYESSKPPAKHPWVGSPGSAIFAYNGNDPLLAEDLSLLALQTRKQDFLCQASDIFSHTQTLGLKAINISSLTSDERLYLNSEIKKTNQCSSGTRITGSSFNYLFSCKNGAIDDLRSTTKDPRCRCPDSSFIGPSCANPLPTYEDAQTSLFPYMRTLTTTRHGTVCLGVLVSPVSVITARDCFCNKDSCADKATMTVKGKTYELYHKPNFPPIPPKAPSAPPEQPTDSSTTNNANNPSKSKTPLLIALTTKAPSNQRPAPCWRLDSYPEVPQLASTALSDTTYEGVFLVGQNFSFCSEPSSTPRARYIVKPIDAFTINDSDELPLHLAAFKQPTSPGQEPWAGSPGAALFAYQGPSPTRTTKLTLLAIQNRNQDLQCSDPSFDIFTTTSTKGIKSANVASLGPANRHTLQITTTNSYQCSTNKQGVNYLFYCKYGELSTASTAETPLCKCPEQFAGADCSRCSEGHKRYPTCYVPKQCPTRYPGKVCSGQGTCNDLTGTCVCKPKIAGALCGYCKELTAESWPECWIPRSCPRNCNHAGVSTGVCNRRTGRCSCTPRITGSWGWCDRCRPGYYDFPFCNPAKTCRECPGTLTKCNPRTGRNSCVSTRNSHMHNQCCKKNCSLCNHYTEHTTCDRTTDQTIFRCKDASKHKIGSNGCCTACKDPQAICFPKCYTRIPDSYYQTVTRTRNRYRRSSPIPPMTYKNGNNQPYKYTVRQLCQFQQDSCDWYCHDVR